MKHIHSILTVIIAAALFAGCNLDPDVAPIPTYDGKADTTIAELLAMHEIGASDSYIHIPEDADDIIISGIVTTSDKHGNCYKYINIEDETGAIQIKINSSTLYNKYRLGQRVFVKCNGLDLGDYRKLPQLGMWANDKIEPIPSGKSYLYIFCDGPTQPVVPSVTMTTIPNADAIPFTNYNRLVKLEGATFVEGGIATYCDPYTATSHDIKMADGTTITMRTSNYADFYNEKLPTGTGTIYGILTRYNNYVQIVIRDLDDVQGFVNPAQSVDVFSVDYANAFNQGWLKVTNGSEWTTMVSSSLSAFMMNASLQTDSWLISPKIDLTTTYDNRLSFSHRAINAGSNTMKCYYTTNYTGDVNTTTWIEVPISNFSADFLDVNFNIPETALSNQFRIAYRYSGNGSTWVVNKIKITGTEITVATK